jgi:hypothetical protein
MGLETTTFLDGLNNSWPLGTDPGPQGDDHLRLIKSVLKDTFPGSGGNGFSKQIVATEDEINYLTGLTENIAAAIADARFPAGTTLPFYNAAPPAGWSLVTLSTTYMLIVGAGNTSGGSDNPVYNDKVPGHFHTASGAVTDPAGWHSHSFAPTQVVEPVVGGPGNIFGGAGNIAISSVSIGDAGEHTHTLSGITVSVNTGAAVWVPRYVGLILCSKN